MGLVENISRALGITTISELEGAVHHELLTVRKVLDPTFEGIPNLGYVLDASEIGLRFTHTDNTYGGFIQLAEFRSGEAEGNVAQLVNDIDRDGEHASYRFQRHVVVVPTIHCVNDIFPATATAIEQFKHAVDLRTNMGSQPPKPLTPNNTYLQWHIFVEGVDAVFRRVFP